MAPKVPYWCKFRLWCDFQIILGMSHVSGVKPLLTIWESKEKYNKIQNEQMEEYCIFIIYPWNLLLTESCWIPSRLLPSFHILRKYCLLWTFLLLLISILKFDYCNVFWSLIFNYFYSYKHLNIQLRYNSFMWVVVVVHQNWSVSYFGGTEMLIKSTRGALSFSDNYLLTFVALQP